MKLKNEVIIYLSSSYGLYALQANNLENRIASITKVII